MRVFVWRLALSLQGDFYSITHLVYSHISIPKRTRVVQYWYTRVSFPRGKNIVVGKKPFHLGVGRFNHFLWKPLKCNQTKMVARILYLEDHPRTSTCLVTPIYKPFQKGHVRKVSMEKFFQPLVTKQIWASTTKRVVCKIQSTPRVGKFPDDKCWYLQKGRSDNCLKKRVLWCRIHGFGWISWTCVLTSWWV